MAFLSNFLEKMDQSAGEIAQDLKTPARDDMEEGAEETPLGSTLPATSGTADLGLEDDGAQPSTAPPLATATTSSGGPPTTQPAVAPAQEIDSDDPFAEDLKTSESDSNSRGVSTTSEKRKLLSVGNHASSATAQETSTTAAPATPQTVPIVMFDRVQADNSALSNHLNAARSDNGKLKDRIGQLDQQIAKQMKAAEATIRKHEVAMQQQEINYQKLENDYNSCMSRLQEVVAQKKNLEEQIVEMKTKDSAGAERVAELQQKLESESSRVDVAREQVISLENQVSELQSHITDISDEKERSMASASQAQNQLSKVTKELAEYKAKAQALLSEKDKTIDYLRGGKSPTTTAVAPETSREDLSSLQEQLRKLSEEKSQESATLEQVQKELQQKLDTESAKLSTLEKDLREAIDAKEEAQHTANAANALYDGEVASHAATRKHLEDELNSKEDQISKMRLKVAAATSAVAVSPNSGVAQIEPTSASGEAMTNNNNNTTANVHELERRVKDLSEMVMEKQAALEAKRSESEQWKTRYEMTQQRLREAEMIATNLGTGASSSTHPTSSSANANLGVGRTAGHRVVTIEDERDVQDSLAGDFNRSQFFAGLQRRGQWGQKVVGVAQQLDSVSLKTGGLLKRNSVLRVALILYVCLLHLWVFVVLSFSGAGADNSATSIGTSTAVEPKV